MVNFGNDWDDVLQEEFCKSYYLSLREFLKKEYATYSIYPDMNSIFNAFKYTPYNKVKVVILGQDPYHNPNQAHGLAFSVKAGIAPPPSLQNIYKELNTDLGVAIPSHGNLENWARQGVFLLNTALTVREYQANSHRGKGWEIFTDKVISILSARCEPIVFLLWGSNARNKVNLIDISKHLVLEAPHPSPLSAYNGFFGCKHFSKTNEFLLQTGVTPIDWQI
ncbi:MAG: uracil-DNA glycosylase [Clostridia bacterium]|nr:uracil-DNA glycosylase [Clostridia bacterium]